MTLDVPRRMVETTAVVELPRARVTVSVASFGTADQHFVTKAEVADALHRCVRDVMDRIDPHVRHPAAEGTPGEQSG